ncbi:hypothetical protein [[Eubacterium] cellulosolvens]
MLASWLSVPVVVSSNRLEEWCFSNPVVRPSVCQGTCDSGAGDRACTITVKIQVLNQLTVGPRKATDQAILQMAEDAMGRPDADLFEITLAP